MGPILSFRESHSDRGSSVDHTLPASSPAERQNSTSLVIQMKTVDLSLSDGGWPGVDHMVTQERSLCPVPWVVLSLPNTQPEAGRWPHGRQGCRSNSGGMKGTSPVHLAHQDPIQKDDQELLQKSPSCPSHSRVWGPVCNLLPPHPELSPPVSAFFLGGGHTDRKVDPNMITFSFRVVPGGPPPPSMSRGRVAFSLGPP